LPELRRVLIARPPAKGCGQRRAGLVETALVLGIGPALGGHGDACKFIGVSMNQACLMVLCCRAIAKPLLPILSCTPFRLST